MIFNRNEQVISEQEAAQIRSWQESDGEKFVAVLDSDCHGEDKADTIVQRLNGICNILGIESEGRNIPKLTASRPGWNDTVREFSDEWGWRDKDYIRSIFHDETYNKNFGEYFLSLAFYAIPFENGNTKNLPYYETTSTGGILLQGPRNFAWFSHQGSYWDDNNCFGHYINFQLRIRDNRPDDTPGQYAGQKL